VEVREVRDAQAGELLRQARERDAELAQAYPSRLEVCVCEAGGRRRGQRLYTSNFSVTGLTETM
jgi:hypothetical protein